ncbi:MAG: CoA transferase, partial [Alphaproteobacteria bacterium]|nr:CoA transferase [Alphaproteobacteria bacterium]
MKRQEILQDICGQIGLPLDGLDALTLTGEDPVLPSSFRVGTAAQVAIAASALAAAEVWQRRL